MLRLASIVRFTALEFSSLVKYLSFDYGRLLCGLFTHDQVSQQRRLTELRGEGHSLKDPKVGELVYSVNPVFRDGTRLRVNCTEGSAFATVEVLNGSAVRIVELDPNTPPTFAKITVEPDEFDRKHTEEGGIVIGEGWIRLQNLSRVRDGKDLVGMKPIRKLPDEMVLFGAGPSFEANDAILEGDRNIKSVEGSSKSRSFLHKLLRQKITQFVLAVALVATLFLPDLWVIGNPGNDQDNILNITLLLFLVIFTLEVIVTYVKTFEYFPLNVHVHSEPEFDIRDTFRTSLPLCAHRSLVKRKDYLWTPFFWMDVLGTLSIFVDFTWTNEYLMANLGGADPGTLRAARVAKLGAKAGRLSRLTKVFKYLDFSSTVKFGNSGHGDPELEGAKDTSGRGAKKLSAMLVQVLSQRVALLIMTMVVVSPFLGVSITDFSSTGFFLGFDEAAAWDSLSATEWATSVGNYREFYRVQREVNDQSIAQPVWLKVRSISSKNCPTGSLGDGTLVTWRIDKDASGYCRFDFGLQEGIIRSGNKHFATSKGHGRYAGGNTCNAAIAEFFYICDKLNHVDALFDNTYVAQQDASLNVILICLVIFLLVTFTAAFNSAVERLLVKPISRIMDVIVETTDTVLSNLNEMVDRSAEVEDDFEETKGAAAEAEVLEYMVTRLARIVEASLGSQATLMLKDEGIDENTKTWLSSAYTDGSGGHRVGMGSLAGDANSGGTSGPPGGGLQRGSSVVLRASISGSSALVDAAKINSFELDVLSYEPNELFPIVKYMFERHTLLREFKVRPSIFSSFCSRPRPLGTTGTARTILRLSRARLAPS